MRLFNAAVLLASGRRSLLSLNILVGTDAGASYGESEYAPRDEGCGLRRGMPNQPTRPSGLIVGRVK